MVNIQVNAGTWRALILIPFCHITKHTVEHIINFKKICNVLNYTFGRKWYYAKCLSNLLLYYMCQLPV